MSMDRKVREFIRSSFSFSYVTTDDAALARDLENRTR
jgi:hypothetical protein